MQGARERRLKNLGCWHIDYPVRSKIWRGEGWWWGKGGRGDEFFPYISIHSESDVIVEEEIWSLGERFRSEIFFLPSENDINFKRKTTFISHTQFLQKQQIKTAVC